MKDHRECYKFQPTLLSGSIILMYENDRHEDYSIISLIIYLSLREGVFLHRFKQAIVKPLLKNLHLT